MSEFKQSSHSAPSPIYGLRIRVDKKDIDVWGHTNNVSYIQWMQDAAVEHSAVLGWTAERYLNAQAIWVVRRHAIDYHCSTYEGENILLQTWIDEMKRASCARRYRFIRLPKDVTEEEVENATGFSTLEDFSFPKNALIAEAETHWAFLSTKTLKPVKVFPELNAVFGSRPGKPAVYPTR